MAKPKIFILKNGTYHDKKGTLKKGSIIISERPLIENFPNKFVSIVIEHLTAAQLPAFRDAIDRFCTVQIIRRRDKFNVVSHEGIPLKAEWMTEAKAKALLKSESKKMEDRKKRFLARLAKAEPIITKVEEFDDLE